MTKKRVSVQIEGRSYAVITTDDEKYVESVAEDVIKHIRMAAQTSRNLDTRDCAILAALDFCDDRNKAMKRNKDVVAKADQIIKQASDTNKSCKEYKERLAEAINENTAFVRKIKTLEKELEKLKAEIKMLTDLLEEEDIQVESKPDSKTEEKSAEPSALQYSLFDDDNKNDKKKK